MKLDVETPDAFLRHASLSISLRTVTRESGMWLITKAHGMRNSDTNGRARFRAASLWPQSAVKTRPLYSLVFHQFLVPSLPS